MKNKNKRLVANPFYLTFSLIIILLAINRLSCYKLKEKEGDTKVWLYKSTNSTTSSSSPSLSPSSHAINPITPITQITPITRITQTTPIIPITPPSPSPTTTPPSPTTTLTTNNNNSVLEDQIKSMTEKVQNLEKQNVELKLNLLKKDDDNKKVSSDNKAQESIVDDTKQSIREMKDTMAQMNQFHGLFESLKMQMLRQKDLKKELDLKVSEVILTESKIKDIYLKMGDQYKQSIQNISSKVSEIDRSNYEINQRVFQIEKESEKDKMDKKLAMSSVNQDSSDFFKSNSDCISRESCNVCVEDPKCVWCSIERKCKSGTQTGPLDGSCLLSFEFATCSQSQCNQFKNCKECVHDEACGWCGARRKCFDGNREKTIYDYCPNEYVHQLNNSRCEVKLN